MVWDGRWTLEIVRRWSLSVGLLYSAGEQHQNQHGWECGGYKVVRCLEIQWVCGRSYSDSVWERSGFWSGIRGCYWKHFGCFGEGMELDTIYVVGLFSGVHSRVRIPWRFLGRWNWLKEKLLEASFEVCHVFREGNTLALGCFIYFY